MGTYVNQARTILGPLTTTFTPPASCFYIAANPHSGSAAGWMGQTCVSTIVNGVKDATECWPQTTAGADPPAWPFRGWGFYSPGLVCPAGYTTACSATASGPAQWPLQFTLVAGETAVGCCPSGFTCFNSLTSGQSCALTARSTALTTGSCDASDSMASAVAAYPQVLTETITDTAHSSSWTTVGTVDAMTAWAPMVQINWQSSDRAADHGGGGPSTTSAAAATAAAGVAPSGASGSDQGAAAAAAAARFSTPTLAVAGSIAGTLALAWGMGFAWRWKRRQASRAAQHRRAQKTASGLGMAPPQQPARARMHRGDLSSSTYFELPDLNADSVLQTGMRRAEAPA